MSQNAKDIHRTLQIVFEELLRVAQNFDGLKMDTVFALGEAMGFVSKAKALVGRDIDDARLKKALEEAHEALQSRAGVGRLVSATPRAPDSEQLPQDHHAEGSAVETGGELPLPAGGGTPAERDDG
jgi:hypothetical protein